MSFLTRESLKIGMPTSSFLPSLGGMEVGLHNIALRLHRRGHVPKLIVPASQYMALQSKPYDLPYEIYPFWPKFIDLSFRYPWAGILAHQYFFNRFQKKHKINMWHATMAYPVGVGLAKFLARNPTPALLRCAGADIQVDKSIAYGMRIDPRIDHYVREWLPRYEALVAITDTVRSEYLNLGVTVEKIFDIPNGVDTKRFASHVPSINLKSKYKIPSQSFVFIAVGRHHPKKNFHALVRASKILKERTRPNSFVCVVVGQGTSDLQSVINAEGLQDYCLALEGISPNSGSKGSELELPASELLDWYKTANAFVFPSKIETFGIVIIEAMAAGLPAIIADSPGCRDVTQNGEYALSFEPDDVEKLADCMEQMMLCDSDRQKYAAKSLQRASTFDWDRVVDSYELLYTKLLKKSRNRI
ncbi:MAG: glycosyltransferase family 4 protein [Alphaproteobacteria bacterium]|nr:glycosyltransferase family 4 protein [Alphaproteobacteria bacterium]